VTIRQFFFNKYRFFILAILLYAAADVLLHKGITRVLLPKNFAVNSSPKTFARPQNNLASTNKHWLKAINTPGLMEKIPTATSGIEWDVYFDTIAQCFKIFHDSSAISNNTDWVLMDIYERRNLQSCIWFDFKNLNKENASRSLSHLVDVREKYHLQNKMIIESSSPVLLQDFIANGFYTSYYVPFFNPYQLEKNSLDSLINTISSNLNRYPVSAISGYYFQYPFLKKYFFGLPILTWTDKSHFSIVGSIFNARLERDRSVAVILTP
jgi:hypothetical protein